MIFSVVAAVALLLMTILWIRHRPRRAPLAVVQLACVDEERTRTQQRTCAADGRWPPNCALALAHLPWRRSANLDEGRGFADRRRSLRLILRGVWIAILAVAISVVASITTPSATISTFAMIILAASLHSACRSHRQADAQPWVVGMVDRAARRTETPTVGGVGCGRPREAGAVDGARTLLSNGPPQATGAPPWRPRRQPPVSQQAIAIELLFRSRRGVLGVVGEHGHVNR